MRDSKGTPDSVDLQPRDLALLRGLFESRIMTARHISILYFDGKPEAAKKRLQKLKAGGYIAERARRVNQPSILVLTRKAHGVLRNEGILQEYPPLDAASLDKRTRVSDLTLRHELEVMDVKAGFHSALRDKPGFSLQEFTTWPLLCQFKVHRPGYGGKPVLVRPDGFIRIHETERDGGVSEHTFFLEVDRSSETQDTLVSRIACYAEYFRSGGFAVKNGATPADFKDFPFRVLVVFKTEQRRDNTAARLLESKPPILTLAWLAVLTESTAAPLKPIWLCPQDYAQLRESSNEKKKFPERRTLLA